MNTHHRKAKSDSYFFLLFFSNQNLLLHHAASFGLGFLKKPWLKHFVFWVSQLKKCGCTMWCVLLSKSVFIFFWSTSQHHNVMCHRGWAFFQGKNWGIHHLFNCLMLLLLLMLCLLWLKNLISWFLSKPIFINVEGTILWQKQNLSSRISCLFTFLYVYKDWAIGQYDPVSFSAQYWL